MTRFLLYLCLLLPLTVQGAEAPGPPDTRSRAVDYLANSITALSKTLYVYKDFADGLNNFTEKVWMGDSGGAIPAMDEAAQGYSGTSGIAARLDLRQHLWGGYMFVNAALKAGGTQPVPNHGESDCGLDLSGATKLVFHAKGETGKERVEFFMGGLGWNGIWKSAKFPDSTPRVSSGVISLTSEWQRYEIDLTGKDLSRINCGFGWVTNDRNNPGLTMVRFSLDDIHYEFDQARKGPMFLASYAPATPGTDEAKINNFAYLYDNAVAAIALFHAGQYERARQIADAIVYALENDRFYTDGRLRNAYSSGDPRGFQACLPSRAKGVARIPGFYDLGSNKWYEDAYAVSTATGNLAWALMALYQQAPERWDYLDAALKIGDFILTLEDSRGGFTGGYQGWEKHESKITYKSTEHNIDLIAAYDLMARATHEAKYAKAAARARAFVLSMYDAKKHCFYTGTTADGRTVNKSILPLDVNTWAVLALGDEFKDGAKVMEFVEQNMRVGQGYGFNSGRAGVWFEGTAQVALAYKQIGNPAKYEEILTYLNANELPDGSISAADREGTSTGFIVGGTNMQWKYGKRPHVGATAWLALAQMGVNPFAIGK